MSLHLEAVGYDYRVEEDKGRDLMLQMEGALLPDYMDMNQVHHMLQVKGTLLPDYMHIKQAHLILHMERALLLTSMYKVNLMQEMKGAVLPGYMPDGGGTAT
jgi:hypothetical protein